MNLEWQLVEVYMGVFMWTLFRVSAIVMTLPVIGTSMVPPRVKLSLSVALSVIAIPLVQTYPSYELMSVNGFLTIINQLLIGFVIGFILQLIFQIFILIGQIVAMQSGLGFAMMNDPGSNLSVPMVSQVYFLMITLLFFALDGHLAFVRIIVESFEMVPISSNFIPVSAYNEMALFGSWMFRSAINISIPALTALLMMNISFGVMTKAAPQLNVFSIGFPLTMIIGVVILWFHLGNIPLHFQNTVEMSFNRVGSFLTGR